VRACGAMPRVPGDCGSRHRGGARCPLHGRRRLERGKAAGVVSKVSEETGRGITSHVAATGKSYNSPDVGRDPYYICSFDDVRSELAVPLVTRIGARVAFSTWKAPARAWFTREHERLASMLADLAVDRDGVGRSSGARGCVGADRKGRLNGFSG